MLKFPQRLTVEYGVFEGFASQAIPLLEEINSHHALQPDRRTSAGFLRIERFNDLTRNSSRVWKESFRG